MSLFDVSITDQKDYLKIVDDDITNITANDATPDSDSQFPNDMDAPFGFADFIEITHNLGSIPLVRAFWDPNHDDTWYSTRVPDPDNFGLLTDPWLKYIVTTSKLKLIMNTDNGSEETGIPVFWRMYEIGSNAVTTDRRIDKVFLKDSTSGVVAGAPSSIDREYTLLTIPHSHGEPPLFTLQFAETADGPWYADGTDIAGPFDTDSGPPGGPYARYFFLKAYMYSRADNVYILLESNYSTSKTIYVRYALDSMQ